MPLSIMDKRNQVNRTAAGHRPIAGPGVQALSRSHQNKRGPKPPFFTRRDSARQRASYFPANSSSFRARTTLPVMPDSLAEAP